MKAAFITGHGGNEVVEVGERPRPLRAPGDVLVRMRAATLNRVDLYMRDSGAGITHRLPQIMGLDGAGIVEEVDASETLLSVGQRVVVHPGVGCGRCEFCQQGDIVLCTSIRYLGEHRDGTLAEYVCVPAANVFPMPEPLDFAEAAALGVNHLTAWRMVFTKARLQPWETVLIFGIGGGVSLAALQLAKLAGSRAIVTSRDDAKLQRAVAMGADHGINGATQDVVREVMAITGGRGVDVVIENVGQAVWPSALKSLTRGGRIVTCGATTGDQPSADLRRIFIRQLQIFGSTLGNFDEYRDLLTFVARHRLRPVIDSRFSLGEVHAALDRLASGEQFGKVAVTVAE
ncbi:NADPH:quinone reductase [Burkholderia sp. lig30]|jgi:NADPH:quinone reductase-like Zn-dependent oxidoreductase|uniref:zinc-binding dehydrogenase n=1 Tax=Burkholderia sp. lig30 TaxID=1192124 RepID=UPI000461EED7|nr:zinc-binding dehydrogenase [Burkholderia sp. lig30]KDB07779.1 NADPH:quinone reductase [Burkholderia sp. lig30]